LNLKSPPIMNPQIITMTDIRTDMYLPLYINYLIP